MMKEAAMRRCGDGEEIDDEAVMKGYCLSVVFCVSFG
jgi:hypothetical protein